MLTGASLAGMATIVYFGRLKKACLMRLLVALLLLAPVCSFAQGIDFEKGNWKSVLAKARKENRLVYVDVYTTWCGPCKVLEKTIFPQKEAGDVYNAHFVNYRLDAEKGEGIALAKKYAVDGFPTHLFIDPKTEAVVYRARGAAGGVARLNEYAGIALSEQKDPMTWAIYTRDFKAGKRNPEFLKAYLRKAERLDKPNDEILDAYVTTLDSRNLPDSTLYFLANHTNTIWNQSMSILDANRSRLEKPDTNLRYYGYEYQIERVTYPSYKEVLAAKDEKKLDKLVAFIRSHNTEDPDEDIFFYRKGYYTEIKNLAKLKSVEWAEGDRLSQKNLADYKEGDAKARMRMEEQVRYQLTGMTLSDTDNVDSIVAFNVARNVGNHPSVRAASTLNELAWNTFENKKATTGDLQQALQWSAKAMEFSAPHPEQWAANADTHASLLYRTGKKAEAVALEEKAEKALRDAGNEKEAAEYGQTIQKMKAGTY